MNFSQISAIPEKRPAMCITALLLLQFRPSEFTIGWDCNKVVSSFNESIDQSTKT